MCCLFLEDFSSYSKRLQPYHLNYLWNSLLAHVSGGMSAEALLCKVAVSLFLTANVTPLFSSLMNKRFPGIGLFGSHSYNMLVS